MHTLYPFALLLFLSLWLNSAAAQSPRRVTGTVVDSAGTALSEATVKLYTKKDTLQAVTDEFGQFSFRQNLDDELEIMVSAIGYAPYRQSHSLKDKKHLNIGKISLVRAVNMLDEVVVTAKPNPVRVMQDTVEYNAAAFRVEEGDNVADLIKQFPGMTVDEEYKVSTMGKDITMLRVNGVDFFTGNVQEFIAKLPAQLVAKIQVIDDFGDQANFTGNKTGEPAKLLNIVTKPGMDKGKFGQLGLNAGSNKQIGSNNGVNLWQAGKQTGMNGRYSTQNNGAGNSRAGGLSINHRNKLGKNGNFSMSYGMNNTANAYAREHSVETVSDLGTYYNNSHSDGNSKNNAHNLSAQFNTMLDKLYLNASFSAGYTQNSNENFSLNNQFGSIKQDFRNSGENTGNSPSVSAGLSVSKKMKNSKNSLSANMHVSVRSNRSEQLVNTNTRYYNQQSNALLKDSVLNRTIGNATQSRSLSFGANYSKALNKRHDSLGRKSLNLSYSFSLNSSANESLTRVLDSNQGYYKLIDSLSSSVRSLFINQAIGLSYSQSAKRNRFSLGLNLNPSVFRNDYVDLGSRVLNTALNFSPSINFSKTIKQGKTLTLNYSGSNNSPSPHQLQPVRNTLNLQNMVIGNPNLKPYFQHRLNSSYNYVRIKSGMSMMVSANFSTVQNEIVNNVLIIPDTLGSYRQETRFENTNGTYSASANYNLNIPIEKGKFSATYGGSAGLSNRALFINNTRYFNRGLNFSQFVSANLNLKKLVFNGGLNYSQRNNNDVVNLMNSFSDISISGMGILDPQVPFNPGQLATTRFFTTRTFSANINGNLNLSKTRLNTSASYSYSSNSNTTSSIPDLQTLSFSLNGNTTVKKVYRISFSASKRINTGYSIANQNPLLIGANLTRQFLKDKTLHLGVGVTDLLNQGNMISRQVFGNSVIDSKSNVITRVVSLSLSYNLSHFGAKGTHMRVDPD